MNMHDESPLMVGWKVSTLSPIVASVRYRALLPIMALEEETVKSHLFANGNFKNLDGLDVLIIIKSFTIDDVCLAKEAKVRGIPLVFDLCDNIFIDGYGKSATNWVRDAFFSIAKCATAIVTSTASLADEIHRQIGHNFPVYIVPDGIETQSLLEAGLSRLEVSRAIVSTGEKRQCVEAIHKLVNKWKSLREGSFRGALYRLASYCRRNLSFRSLKTHTVHFLSVLKAYRKGQTIQVQSEPIESPGILDTRDDLDQFRTEKTIPSHITGTVRRILWFGHHGAPYASFGMLDLLEIRQELEAIALEFPVELVVVSNNVEKFLKYIQPFEISSRYIEWSVAEMVQHVRDSDIVVVPNTRDPFSSCKSSNRTVLALACGVPVIATSTPALTDLRDVIQLDDFMSGLRCYLSDRDFAKRQAESGRELVQELYGQAVIGQAWRRIIGKMVRSPQDVKIEGRECIFVLNLIQDLDLVVPALKVALRRSLSAEVWCRYSLFKNAPRVRESLEEMGIPWRVWPEQFDKQEMVKSFHATKVLLTASESTLEVHQFAHSITKIAKESGIITGTLQHGFENVGLTYSDEQHPIKKIEFASDRIYLWGSLKTLHRDVPARTLKKCLSVGWTKDVTPTQVDLSAMLPKQGLVVGVFENLHWHRYSDDYREFFIEGVRDVANVFPDVTFVLKPHPAGMWLAGEKSRLKANGKNLIIVDPKETAWKSVTTPQILSYLDAVMTSPSTVVLDAAHMGLPVALVAHSLQLDNYRPFFMIRAKEDWKTFLVSVTNASDRKVLLNSNRTFVDRVLLPENAADNIVDDLIGCFKAQKKKAI